MSKIALLIIIYVIISLFPPSAFARDPYPNKPRLKYQLMPGVRGAIPKTLLKPDGTRSDLISFACYDPTTSEDQLRRENRWNVIYLTAPTIDSMEKATNACKPKNPPYTVVWPPYLKNNKETPECIGKEYDANCYDSPLGEDFMGSVNYPWGSLFKWVAPMVYSAQGGVPSLCGPNRDQLCGKDCIYTPITIGPKSSYITLEATIDGVYQECVAPPYTTSGSWWNEYLGKLDNERAATSMDKLVTVGMFFGIDGESRPFKSDMVFKTLAGDNTFIRFYRDYAPAVIREVKKRYPGIVIRGHADKGMVETFLENDIDFHRESLNADAYGSYTYSGLGTWGFWQGPANFYWVTNSLGLQGWKPMYQTALAGLSLHTDMITGIILEGLYQDGKGDFLKFIGDYIGRNINDTPGVWTHLRETRSKKEADWHQSGKYGDYDYYLYRAEDLEGNKTVPVITEDLPAGTASQIYNYGLPLRRWQLDTVNLFVGRKNAPGNKYMSFDIDDGYRYTGKTGVSFDVRIVYLDVGTDSLKFQYKNSDNQWQEKVITKTRSDLWKEIRFTIDDAFFNNNASEGSNANIYPTDFRIETNGSTIHLIEVRGKGSLLEAQRPKVQISCDLVENESDDPKDGVFSLGYNRNLKIKARLVDNNGKPIPNERVMFTYNTEWNLTKSATTDQNGVAFSPLSTTRRLDSSGFVLGASAFDEISTYSVQAYYPGNRTYQPSRNDCYLDMTRSMGRNDPTNTRMKITNIDTSQINTTGKVKVAYEIYNLAGSKIDSKTVDIGKRETFNPGDPNSQTIHLTWGPGSNAQVASNNITLNITPAQPPFTPPISLKAGWNTIKLPHPAYSLTSINLPSFCSKLTKKPGAIRFSSVINFRSGFPLQEGSKYNIFCSQNTAW